MGLALILFVVLLGAKAAAGDASEEDKASLKTVLSLLEDIEKNLPSRAEITHSFARLQLNIEDMLEVRPSLWTPKKFKPIWDSLVDDLKDFEEHGHIDTSTVDQLIQVIRKLGYIYADVTEKPHEAYDMIYKLDNLHGAPMYKLVELIKMVDFFL